MSVFDLIQAETLATIWESNKNRPPYLGEAFFPNKRQKGLSFEYIKGKDNTPVALVSANFNTNVLYRDRVGVEKVKGKLPFFKEAMSIEEELRQELLEVKPEYQQTLINKIFDDEQQLLMGAEVTAERMRMQLISQGTISIVENGVDKQYDYGFDQEKQFKEESVKWSADTAKPLASMQKRIEDVEDSTDKDVLYIVMSKSLARMLYNSKEVYTHFASLQSPIADPSLDQRKAYVEAFLNKPIIVNDKKYIEARDETRTEVPFYPNDRYTLLLAEDLGNTIYGTTPEEADLLGGQSKASSVKVLSNGVTITTWTELDPVNVNTKVSEVVVPSCPMIDRIYITKVLA